VTALGRVALIVALLANITLYRIAGSDDLFALIVSVASGVSAVALAAGWRWPRVGIEGAWLAIGVWVASLTELVTDATPRWETQVRVGGFFLAFLLVTLGVYWLAPQGHRDRQ
jgi:hypothetical protein